MVIVDPDEWEDVRVLGFESADGFHRLASKELVRLDVGLPVLRGEDGPVRHGVEQRPESAVAAAVVELVKKGLPHVHWDDLLRMVKTLQVLEHQGKSAKLESHWVPVWTGGPQLA